MDCAIGYRIAIVIVLTMVAGRTTAPNNAANGPGKPTMKYADVKKTIPEISVPIAVRTEALIMD